MIQPYGPISNYSPRSKKKCIDFHINSDTRVGEIGTSRGTVVPIWSIGVK